GVLQGSGPPGGGPGRGSRGRRGCPALSDAHLCATRAPSHALDTSLPHTSRTSVPPARHPTRSTHPCPTARIGLRSRQPNRVVSSLTQRSSRPPKWSSKRSHSLGGYVERMVAVRSPLKSSEATQSRTISSRCGSAESQKSQYRSV